jgi:SagB-type dehydrogenase family enzyme
MSARLRWAPLMLATLFVPSIAASQELSVIRLPKPDTEGGVPLMQALAARQTTRSFRSEPLPLQTLSDLLWAAFGVNRPESGKRTAPSAVNWQETDIFVFMQPGVFLYEATAHELRPVREGDLRHLAGTQEFVRSAPLTLVLVADLSRITDPSPEQKSFYSAVDAGFISQNIYLYCASAGLATGVRALIDRPALSEALGLRPEQKIIVAQSVGYPGN